MEDTKNTQTKEPKFWDIAPLLSQVDLDGMRPEIFMVSSNRSAGKTTNVNRYGVNQFLKKNKLFCLEYRFCYELDDVPDKFFGDIKGLFFPEYDMDMKKCGSGTTTIYSELYLAKNGGEHEKCGYAVALNQADQIRKYAHKLNDSSVIIMDEFQSESDHYCPNETAKFQSVHTSLARGGGKMSRYLPVIMMSNPVSLLNPYYDLFDVAPRIVDNAKFIRGHGWVLEHHFNESAAQAQSESRFNVACAGSDYAKYASQAVYLNDNKSMIGKKTGRNTYVATIRYKGDCYAIRQYDDGYYVDDKPDLTYGFKVAVTPNDIGQGYTINPRIFLSVMTDVFNSGHFMFKNLKCKEALFKLLSRKV